MTFLALVAALLIERLWSRTELNSVCGVFRRYSALLERSFDDGRYEHGVIAWLAATGPPLIVVASVSIYLNREMPLLAFALNVGVLYFTMSYRLFSDDFTATLEALRAGDTVAASAQIEGWRGYRGEDLSPQKIAQLAIERGLTGAHRNVFGVIAWFAVFGAAGAVLYRLGAILRDSWGTRPSSAEASFGEFSRTAFKWIDWIPARLTAVSFAIVGDFEDAIYCWRTQAHTWYDANEGVVLAAGAGAIGVRLGSDIDLVDSAQSRPELGTGDEADVMPMTGTIGLIWRAFVLWPSLILLLTVPNWLG